MTTTGFLIAPYSSTSQINEAWKLRSPTKNQCSNIVTSKSDLNFSLFSSYYSSASICLPCPCLSTHGNDHGKIPSSRPYFMACASSSRSTTSESHRLYVSGLSFRTTTESLRNAFEKFGQLVDVHLVMDKVANRPRGFAFLSYETEEESKNAIAGMHIRQNVAHITKDLLGRIVYDVFCFPYFLARCETVILLVSAFFCIAANMFLDGRVIFVEVAIPRPEMRKNRQNWR